MMAAEASSSSEAAAMAASSEAPAAVAEASSTAPAMESSSSSEMVAMAMSSSETPVAVASSSSEAPVVAVAENKLPATVLSGGGDIAIAAPGSAADGYGYVGVWAKDAAGCAQIGTAGAADFAVITRSTFRNGPSACYGNFGALADGKAALTIACSSGKQSIAVAQSAPDTLTVNDAALVRCKP